MKNLCFILLGTCFTLFSCSNNDNDSKNKQQHESEILTAMHEELVTISLVNTQACTKPDEWAFTSLISATCGGDQTSIIYLKKIDTVLFFKKLKIYNDASLAYAKKWNTPPTCFFPKPIGIKCVDNKPAFEYESPI